MWSHIYLQFKCIFEVLSNTEDKVAELKEKGMSADCFFLTPTRNMGDSYHDDIECDHVRKILDLILTRHGVAIPERKAAVTRAPTVGEKISGISDEDLLAAMEARKKQKRFSFGSA